MVAPRTSHLKLNSISSCFKVTTMLCVHIWGVNPDVHTAELVNIFFCKCQFFFHFYNKHKHDRKEYSVALFMCLEIRII